MSTTLVARVYNPAEAAAGEFEVSVVMPCLNEARTVGRCVGKALQALKDLGVSGEVIVADNGSTDGSQGIALGYGARVIDVERRGYGHALRAGIQAARGCYIIMGDSDDSYDFTALAPFVEQLRAGYDLVMGNRFRGGIRPGAMPWLHRYVGNPVLTGILNLFFHSPIGDAHCGLRGFRKDSCATQPGRPGDGIRQRDGGQGHPEPPEDRRGADRAASRWPRSSPPPEKLPRRLAPPEVHASLHADLPVHPAGDVPDPPRPGRDPRRDAGGVRGLQQSPWPELHVHGIAGGNQRISSRSLRLPGQVLRPPC